MNFSAFSKHYVYLLLTLLLVACGGPAAVPVPSGPLDPASLTADSTSGPLSTLIAAIEGEGYSLQTSKATTVTEGTLTITTVPIAEVASVFTRITEGDTLIAAQYTEFVNQGGPLESWPICHYPPGNPANAHTIYVGYSAIETHVKRHGDTLGFCPSDMAGNADLAIKSVVLSPGNDPIYTKATYDTAGEVVLLENGESLGTDSLTKLLTLKPTPPQVPEDTAMRDFANFIRTTLGEEAQPFLDAIPASMGGDGSENGVSLFEGETANVVTECGENGSECPDPDPDPEDPPSGSNPDDPGDDPETPPGEGDGEGDSGDPNSDDPGDEDDSDDDPSGSDPGDNGPQYDPAELARLEGEVERWEDGIEEIEELIAGYEEELGEAYERKQGYLDKAEEIIITSEPRLAEIEEEILELDEDLANVNSDIVGDNIGIGLGAVGVVGSCPTSPTGGGALFCAGSAGGLKVALDSRKSHVDERDGYEQEREDLVWERDDKITEAEIAVGGAAYMQNEVIEPLETEIENAEGLLELAEEYLETAQGNLDAFKDRHDID